MQAGEYVLARQFASAAMGAGVSREMRDVFIRKDVGRDAGDKFVLVVGADVDLAVFAGEAQSHLVSLALDGSIVESCKRRCREI